MGQGRVDLVADPVQVRPLGQVALARRLVEEWLHRVQAARRPPVRVRVWVVHRQQALQGPAPGDSGP